MSRSGYSEDCDEEWRYALWRGSVTRAIRGKRGQIFIKDLIGALEDLSEKKLIADNLIDCDGNVCALGAVGKARQIDMTGVDPEDIDRGSHMFNIADALTREVVYINDQDGPFMETPESRYQRVYRWARSQLMVK